jgi:oxygen-independent coproporphyrinogen-3 oxidase
LPPEALATLILEVGSSTPLLDAVEITLEANPEDVTPAAVRIWRDAGVNRVSLGVQSFDDRVLSWMHRVHDAAQARRAVDLLRDAGMGNLSLDLIFGLPAELGRDWGRDLDAALAAEPDHLSLYGLTVEPRTPLARWIARGRSAEPSDERYAEEYLLAHERLARAGYTFYEVSNAARPARRSRHNSAYWSGAAYLGVGPAAHSFDGRVRWWNVSAWEAYRRAIAAGQRPTESAETLSADQQAMERLYLGLRTVEGVPVDGTGATLASLPPLLEQQWLRRVGERLQCTPEGWLRLDAVINALTASPASS